MSLGAVSGADRTMLEDIAADYKNPGRPEAQAWLVYLGDGLPEEMRLPSTAKSLRNRDERSARAKAPSLLGAYPNPGNGPLYLVYTVPEGVEQAELHMHDAAGRLVHRQRVAPQSGIAELLPEQMASGMHVAVLLCDGIRTGTVTVIRSR